MQLANYLTMQHRAEAGLADAFRRVAEAHTNAPDVYSLCHTFANQTARHVELLGTIEGRYARSAPPAPEQLHDPPFAGPRAGLIGLLRDLHELYQAASGCSIAWRLLGQAAQGARDAELIRVVDECDEQTTLQVRWLRTRLSQLAPQALLVG